eukprot:3622855-Pleurochrysis_carterae.AAC.1
MPSANSCAAWHARMTRRDQGPGGGGPWRTHGSRSRFTCDGTDDRGLDVLFRESAECRQK